MITNRIIFIGKAKVIAKLAREAVEAGKCLQGDFTVPYVLGLANIKSIITKHNDDGIYDSRVQSAD